jgi:hypothetical protein
MNIVIVSREQASPVSFDGTHLSLGRADCDVWLRSAISGLLSLPMDVVIFLPGCSDAQKAAAIPKTFPVNGKVVDLDRVATTGLLGGAEQLPGCRSEVPVDIRRSAGQSGPSLRNISG